MREQIQLLKIVAAFLDRLSEEELQLLLEKKAKLKLEPVEKQTKDTSTVKLDIAAVCSRLESCATREEAERYMAEAALTKAELKAIAKKYSIPVTSRDNIDQLTRKIIENTVGARLKFDALLNIDLRRKKLIDDPRGG